MQGVAFLVNKELTNSILNITIVSSRIISIRIQVIPFDCTLIQVYAPITDYLEEEIEIFYEQIEDTIKHTPRKDLLIIMGDWNAKVGVVAHATWPNAIGRFGNDITNERGERLLECSDKHKLLLSNTIYNHTKSRIATWHSPNGQTHNQIDYILTPQRYKSSIIKTSTRTYPGVDINSDHDLVICNMKLKLCIKERSKTSRIRYDLVKLRNNATNQLYKNAIQSDIKHVTIEGKDPTTICNEIKTMITEAATKTIGIYRIRK